ncbi:MAG: response regulator [Cellvibrio sp.]|uniref:response regulator n=1 Tax=Cellvibrio sp. TaxID=1965322 RepID=UPI0031B541A9
MTNEATDLHSAALEADRFGLFVAGVADYAIYVLSPEGIVSSWNVGAQRFKGYTAAEIIGQHFSRFYTVTDIANGVPARALKTAIECGKFEDEGLRVRKDGTQFWATVVIDPIRDNKGELIGFTKITRDITERREAAALLEKAKEALFQSQKVESLGRLTGGIAHDFNNLLSVIANGIEILRLTTTNPSHTKILDSMESAATRGANLTQQMLSFARQQPLKQELHDLNRIVISFESVLRRALKSAVQFELNLASALPDTLVDAVRFEAALLNLIVNSNDAIAESGRVTVSTYLAEVKYNQVKGLQAGRYVCVSVKDTGHGIDTEQLDKVVEPFFTTKPIGKGTGLGLSQVYGLMQQSEGGMEIRSTLGEGTEICLYMPVSESDSSTKNVAAKNSKVLVVDDQPEVLDTAAQLFRALGYDVFAANNGRDAIELLQRHKDLNLLFSDIVMPGMSGLELARIAMEMNPALKIILATGYTAEMVEKQAEYSAQFTVISKPYKISEIVQRLQAQ